MQTSTRLLVLASNSDRNSLTYLQGSVADNRSTQQPIAADRILWEPSFCAIWSGSSHYPVSDNGRDDGCLWNRALASHWLFEEPLNVISRAAKNSPVKSTGGRRERRRVDLREVAATCQHRWTIRGCGVFWGMYRKTGCWKGIAVVNHRDTNSTIYTAQKSFIYRQVGLSAHCSWIF